MPFHEGPETIEGPTMDLEDNRPLCAFPRICDGHGRIWNSVPRTEDEQQRSIVAHQGSPSGRLLGRDKLSGEQLEPPVAPSIALIEDPQKEVSGPIWVRGGVTDVGADGSEYERRNRVTLCRCGASSNKPFCDGAHAHIGFRAGPTTS